MPDHEYVDVPVVAMDIKDSSRHEGAGQADLYASLQELFDAACTEVGLEIDSADRADRGDGNVIVIRSGFPLAKLVADLAREFAGQLDQFNRNRSDDARLRVRMAVQRGPVTGNPGRWDGHAVVDAVRIMESETVKALLTEHRDVALALGISQTVYDSTVRERLRHLDPDRWAAFGLGGTEKGAGLRAWARLLGNGSPNTTVAPVAAPPPPRPQPVSGVGNRTIGQATGPVAMGDCSNAIGTVHGNVGGGHG